MELTVCSVSYHSAPYLNLNYALIDKFFPGQDFEWVVLQNTPTSEKFDNEDFIILEGVPQVTDDLPGFIGYASVHHGRGLNKLIASHTFNTRYVAFLDPDFYLTVNFGKIIDHMKKNSLAVFGAPYMPSIRKRKHNFPVAFCMFIDREQVDLSSLDFCPVPKLEKKGIIADTGYSVYTQLDQHPHDIALPSCRKTKCAHTTLTLAKYKLKPKMKVDEYWWQGKFFGLHAHMKLHLREKTGQIKQRVKSQIGEIERIITSVIRHDTSV